MRLSIQKLSVLIISLFSFLVIFFYSPAFLPPSILPRQIFIILLPFLLLILFSLKIALFKKIEIFSVPLAFPLIVYSVANLISSLISPGKLDSLLTTATIFAFTLIYLLIPQIITTARTAKFTLFIISFLISISALAPLIPNKINFPGPLKYAFQSLFQNSAIAVNTTGSTFITSLVLLIMLPVVLGLLFSFFRKKSLLKIIPAVFLCVIFFGGAVVSLKTLNLKNLNNTEIPFIPNNQLGWVIALETIKNKPLFGIGQGNYTAAYTLYKPFVAQNVSYPTLSFTPNTTSSNEYFQLLTTIGVIGILSYIFFILSTLSALLRKLKKNGPLAIAATASFIIFIILQTLVPIHFILFFFIILLLGLLQSIINTGPSVIYEFSQTTEEDVFEIKSLPLILSLILTLVIVYPSYRILSADYFEKTAIEYAIKNDAQKALDFSQKAVNQNPYSDAYRIVSAQINFSAAQNLINTKGKDLSEAEKTQALEILKKSVDEGKMAVSLNPLKSKNIEILAAIYQSLINTAPNADQFALDSLNQAINVDPTNPKLRVDLGGIYFGKNEYATASSIFQSAIYLQSNYPNAYYNLGYVLLRLNQFDDGIKSLESALSLLPNPSQNRDALVTEIESLKSQIASLSASPAIKAPPAPKPTPIASPPSPTHE